MTAPTRDENFETLLRFMRQSRGFDFTGYKRSTLMRRVQRRMDQVHTTSYPEYLDYLKAHHDEFLFLFNTILINVTAFFRDPPAWDYLSTQILPRLLNGKSSTEPIRIWTAACASGEEAYTLAMVLVEALGMNQYRDRVKIYATDVDEDALTRARQGTFAEKDVEEVPAALRDKYFEGTGGRVTFRNDLRRSIIFGRHDLLQDAPISRIDLLLCRNTLMYFEAETQGKILARLHYALADKGYLFLGKAEMLLTRDTLFTPVDPKARVFTKVLKVGVRERMLVLAKAGNPDAEDLLHRQIALQEIALDAGAVAQIVVDPSGFLVMANERARSLFGLSTADIGRRIQDLEVSYRPLELRSRLEQVAHDRQPQAVPHVERQSLDGSRRYLDVNLAPLLDHEGKLIGTSVTFGDVSSFEEVHKQLERSKQELETASEELQSTNEELETTNEELQSTVEELETTNEELQSSNEELETMNEELESTNSELQAINTELQQRSLQLDQVNRFMESILTNVRLGVAVLGTDLRVQLWNQRAEDLWGVRAAEVQGQSFLGLDIGLPVGELAESIKACLIGKAGSAGEIELESTNRRGRSIRCRVQCTPLLGPDAKSLGVILLMEEMASEPAPVSRDRG